MYWWGLGGLLLRYLPRPILGLVVRHQQTHLQVYRALWTPNPLIMSLPGRCPNPRFPHGVYHFQLSASHATWLAKYPNHLIKVGAEAQPTKEANQNVRCRLEASRSW